MTGTVVRPSLEGSNFRSVTSFMLARKVHWLVILAGISGALIALFGSVEFGTPSATGGSSVSFLRLFSVVSGTLPALVLVSPLKDLEESGGNRLRRLETVTLVVVLLLSSAFVAIGSMFGEGGVNYFGTGRSILTWFGLALISGRVMGWRFPWVLPWVVLSALLYWGYDSNAHRFQWWEFTAQPMGHWKSAWLSLAIVGVGMVFYSATTWRLAALKKLASRNLMLRLPWFFERNHGRVRRRIRLGEEGPS